MPIDPHTLPVPDFGFLCKHCRYPLGGLMQRRCPECGREFSLEEYIPDGDFPPVILGGKYVTLTPQIEDLLRRERIPLMRRRGAADRLYGEMGATDRSDWLTVPRTCYFEVLDLLRQEAAGVSSEALSTPSGEGEPDWSCTHCGEINPETFEICWNCGEERTRIA